MHTDICFLFWHVGSSTSVQWLSVQYEIRSGRSTDSGYHMCCYCSWHIRTKDQVSVWRHWQCQRCLAPGGLQRNPPCRVVWGKRRTIAASCWYVSIITYQSKQDYLPSPRPFSPPNPVHLIRNQTYHLCIVVKSLSLHKMTLKMFVNLCRAFSSTFLTDVTFCSSRLSPWSWEVLYFFGKDPCQCGTGSCSAV